MLIRAVIVYLFIIAAALLVLMVLFSMAGEGSMPWTCPACFRGWEEDLFGQYQPWYVSFAAGRVRCRWCARQFKEAPNGTLVEDR